ncbi:N-acyl homoserine lactonase family protein [Mucilaginibacter xinganensis]|uniref:Glyoxylase, beta-lactamase superfamily II n=1 Tax=Mucilaginibacter xinganensis TaxID=1234841 RepID=A0A223NYB7_9SPHI|nr:N-acyl homoserine lactonase family protein [Mucilaginibacter xinganensis]ASU34694.1 Glyoxylase, beta-lactamase superfamily II [Mucilaginibacter xinganensis]
MKKTGLLSIFLLIIMLAAHAQKAAYKVYAIKFAASAYPFTAADWAKGGPKTDSVKINFMIWLIKGNGRNILVDAGFLSDIGDAKDFKVIDYVRPDSAISKLGLKATDITDIIFSHPHWDHIDGAGLFPNAHIWIQKEDFNYFVSTAWQKGESNGGFNKRDVRMMIDLNLAGKVTLVDGDNKEIIPGIKVFTGSRHTYNSEYVLVQTGMNKVILASDNIWIYYSLEHLVPASDGGTLDPAGYVKAMQRMKTMVTDVKFIIPGHDAKVFSKFPAVADGVAEIK